MARSMNACALIIFGATGDLARKKLLPSLYRLFIAKKLTNFFIVGVSFDQADTQTLLDEYKMHVKPADTDAWHQFCQLFTYQQLNFEQFSDYTALYKTVSTLEKRYATDGNRLIYLASPAHFFCTITTHLVESKLVEKRNSPNEKWHRVVYEKPFGHDLPSAQAIHECISQLLDENQIYCIDHYLTKELVSNITLIRFTNCVFEPLWNNRYIDNVQIIVSETGGIQDRGLYYDHYGALKDMVQNHMLELAALIAMEAPEKLVGNAVARQRAIVLSKLKIIDVLKGQYDGYRTEKNVPSNSKTETFVALAAQIENNRWAGVPFYLKTGKFLDKQETVIHIKFKQVDCLLARDCPSESNYLTIQIAPDASFWLSLNAKKPESLSVMPVKMEFCHSCLFGPEVPQAYEVLLAEIIKGERSIAVHFDEIKYAWQAIDQISDNSIPVYTYAKHTNGPKELTQFNQKHGVRWRS